MVGFPRSFKRDQGMHLEGDGVVLDIDFRGVIGSGYERKARFDVRGLNDVSESLILEPNEETEVAPGVRMKLLPLRRHGGVRAYTSCVVDDSYLISLH